MRLFVLAVALLALPATLHAQTATLTGRITSADGPVPGATVRAADRGTAADVEGRYELAVPAGAIEIVVTAVGFETAREPVTLADGETRTLDVVLTATALSLGDVVVEAASSIVGPRGVRDVPGSVTVLGGQALARQRDTDLHRVLGTVPGVSVQEEDGYGLRPNIGIRGTQTDRSSGVTLMEDGVLIAPAPYAAPAAYYIPPAGRLDGIEVRKGSAQIVSGPYTTGGAVNLLAARIPSEPSFRVEARGGTDRARTLHLRAGTDDVGAGPVRLGAIVEGFADGVDGFKDVRAFDGSDRVLSEATGYQIWSGLARVRASLAASPRAFHSLELKLTADAQTSDETYLGLTPQDFEAAPFSRYASTAGDRFTSEHGLGHLRYVGVFGRSVDVSATLYATRFRRDWVRVDAISDGRGDDVDTDADGIEDADLMVPIARLLADPILFADELAVARGVDTRSEAVLDIRSNDRRFGAEGLDLAAGLRASSDLSVRAGLRFHQDRIDLLQTADAFGYSGTALVLTEAGTPGNAGNRIARAEAVAAFTEATWTRGRLTLTPGLRVEHVRQSRDEYAPGDVNRETAPEVRENTTTALIPGLGLRYDVTADVAVFGGVHRGFAPGTSAPGVEPERSVNTEIGLRTRRGEAVALQAVAFGTWYSNLLGADFASSGGTGSGELFNGGAATVMGAEIALDADALALASRQSGSLRAPVRLAYTATDARFSTRFESAFLPWGTVFEGDAIPYVAPHVLSASLGLGTEAGQVNLRANYTATTRAVAGQGPIPESERVDARLLFDLSAEWTLPGTQVRALALVRNLTDEVYVASLRPAGLRPGLPRTILLGLRADL
ncbi:MAG: TonB-dependent receptor [Bacteroidota bacterium]